MLKKDMTKLGKQIRGERTKIGEQKKEKMVSVTIELPDHIILEAMLLAHKMDITFNEWCRMVLREYMKKNPLL